MDKLSYGSQLTALRPTSTSLPDTSLPYYQARDSDGQLVHGIDFEKLKAELSSSCIPDS